MNELDLEAYLDGELEPTQRRRVQAQLQTDPELRRRLRELEALRSLCRRAGGAEPSPSTLARLEWSWQQLLRGAKVSGLIHITAAAVIAAALPLAALRFWHDEPGRAPVPRTASVQSGRRTPPRALVQCDESVERPLSPATVPKAVSGEPYESLLVATAERMFAQQQGNRAKSLQTPPEDFAGVVDQAVQTLLAGGTVESVAADYFSRPGPWELQVVRYGRAHHRATRRAAVQLLATVGTRRCISWLVELADDPACRADAARILGGLADPLWLARAVQAEQRPEVRGHLLAAIAGQPTDRCGRLMVNFIRQKHTSDDALRAIEELPAAPNEAYWNLLNDPRQAVRLAAARALGRCQSAQVTAELSEQAVHGPNRREALVALVSSPWPKARELVATMNHDLFWRGPVSAAACDLQTLD